MPKIAISYRRTDADATGRIFDRLVQRYGKGSVFRDIDDIPFGIDFRTVVNDALRGTDLLIAVVGPNWRGARRRGSARINDENDLVRIEVETALQRDIPVIPVLVGGAVMPKAVELPDCLRDFSFRNAANIDSGRNFDTDIERLMRSMDRLFTGKTAQSEATQAKARPQEQAHATAEQQSQERAEEDRRRRDAEAEQRRLVESEAKWRAEGRIKVEAKIVHGAPNGWFKPGAGKIEWFQDHECGPEMVVVPAGEFMMGSPKNEPDRGDAEDLHRVKLAHPFSVGRHAITRGQFAAFMNNTNYRIEGGAWVLTEKLSRKWTGKEVLKYDVEEDPNASWRNPGFLLQDDNHPVVCVNWDDVRAYLAWLSQITGRTYRLQSEAEWEYVARAGTTTPYWWGSSITPALANYSSHTTVPVDNFEANPWGLYNVHGNVLEWCEDTWHDNYEGAPVDGSAWVQDGDTSRVQRGGSWQKQHAWGLFRSASRWSGPTDWRTSFVGFRVGRTLTP
jgi:formylglycine-generating enzyme required for sulfatase activity